MGYNLDLLTNKSDHGATSIARGLTPERELPVLHNNTRSAQSTQENLSTEQWREIPGSDGRYEVSDRGRVRSWYYRKRWQGKPLYRTSFTSKIGYVYYRLWIGDKPKNYAAHRLVLAAFVGESDCEANHIDGDKTHNWLYNLEYATHSENIQHSFDVLGRKMKSGEDNHRAKLSDSQIAQLRQLSSAGVRNRDLAAMFEISSVYVSNIKNNKVRVVNPE